MAAATGRVSLPHHALALDCAGIVTGSVLSGAGREAILFEPGSAVATRCRAAGRGFSFSDKGFENEFEREKYKAEGIAKSRTRSTNAGKNGYFTSLGEILSCD
jgi:hypothetical protein